MSEHKSIPDELVPPALIQEVALQSSRIVSADFLHLAEELQRRFTDCLDAIILYGSCMHSRELTEGVVDFYVVVDDYKHAYRERYLRYLNAWLPPNVFYLEVDNAGLKLRAKYAVISMADFEAGTRDWFHSYLWARFAQPVRVLYIRDDLCRKRIDLARARAVMRFLKSTVPVLGSREVDVEEIWTEGLALAYAAELRPERDTRARQLTHLNLGDYTRLTAHAAPALGEKMKALEHNRYQCNFNAADSRRALRQWRWRCWQGRLLSVLRLTKAAFTFKDCLDYAAWKIKRHTGVSVEVTPRLKRHPLLWGYRVLWQLLRRGVMR